MPHWRTYMPRISGMMSAADVPEDTDKIAKIGEFKKSKLRKKDNGSESKLTLLLVTSTDAPAFVDGDGNALWWPINSTNGEMLERLLGSGDPADWVGRVITLYQTETRGEGGKQVACIRVRNKLPSADRGPQARRPTAKPAAASKPTASAPPPAAHLPPIDTHNDVSQTYVPEYDGPEGDA